jgi:hypothetical protein
MKTGCSNVASWVIRNTHAISILRELQNGSDATRGPLSAGSRVMERWASRNCGGEGASPTVHRHWTMAGRWGPSRATFGIAPPVPSGAFVKRRSGVTPVVLRSAGAVVFLEEMFSRSIESS